MALSTRRIVITGMLGAIAIVLGATGIGFIPVPTPIGKATILHIPAILAGIMEGPVVGALVGLIFGLYSFLSASSPLAADPVVAITPRILIGIVSYYVYTLFRKRPVIGAGVAAVAGTMTNTIGFLGLGVLQGYIKWAVVWMIIATHSIFEVIVAVAIVVALVKALQRYLEQV
ncbi:MAG: ECF transporter S component [Bacillota bacterium]|uniref:ECF transporter S component n=1 Tax=Thermanaerosceptrum fracticalcis TaxID=1712410 RepID=A0A7G6E5Q1_THEFR|nr:ECF transporter S component [Thermanaerosceptrum fracticalcis]QNB47405.1 ECF transporter S component [Thermanaerosceptrum fracticalcis]